MQYSPRIPESINSVTTTESWHHVEKHPQFVESRGDDNNQNNNNNT